MKNSIFLLTLFVFGCAFSQSPTDLPNVMSPSPEVAGLMKFEEVPVEMYTGQPGISIPILSQTGNAGLSNNISLNYHSTGVRVDSRSGTIGTGWSINSSAVISRTVIDIPDEAIRNGVSNETGMWHLSEYWTTPVSVLSNPGFNWKVNGSSLDHYDSQSDVFQYNIFGNTGRFIIKRSNPGAPLEAVILDKKNNSKIEIFYNANSLVINSFLLTDESGKEYLFDIVESSDYESISISESQGISGVTNVNSQIKYNVHSAWHLSEVKSSNGEMLLECTYVNSTEDYTTTISTQTNRITSIDQIDHQQLLLNSYNASIVKPAFTASANRTTSRTKKMDSIIFSTDNYIKFKYSNISHPETGGLILERIESKDRDHNLIKTVRLNSSIENSRLWLNSIEDGNDPSELQQTSLVYYDKDLPSHDGDTDDFGYKSPINVQSQYTFSSFDPNAILSGLLTSITFPTGGSKDFEWEEHQFSYFGDQLINDWNENPENTIPKYIAKSIDHTQVVAGNPTPTTTLVDSPTLFTITHPQDIEVRTNITENTPGSLNYYKLRIHKNGQPYQTINISTITQKMFLDTGQYSVFLDYTGFLNSSNSTTHSVQGSYLLKYVELNSNPFPYLKGGGLRISKIVFNDGNQPAITKQYSYQAANSNYSSGSVDGDFRKMRASYTLTHDRYLIMPFVVDSDPNCGVIRTYPHTIYYEITENSLFNIQTKGSYVGYKNVTVSEQGKGASNYVFSSPIDFPAPALTLTRPYTKPLPRNLDYKRGNLLSETHVDNQNKVISTNEFSYIYHDDQELYNFVQYTCEDPWLIYYDLYSNAVLTNNVPTKNIPMGCGTYPSNLFGTSDRMGLPSSCFPLSFDHYYSTWVEKTESITKEYFYDDAGVAEEVLTTVDYDYDPNNYQVSKQTTTNSKDEILTSETVFSSGYVPATWDASLFNSTQWAVINHMKNANITSRPILQKSYLNNQLSSTVQYIYDQPVTDQFVAQQVRTAKGGQNLETRLIYHKYDSYDNILEVSKADGTYISYIWGYNDSYPIAKIEGLSYAELAALLNISQSALENYNENHLNLINGLRSNFTVEKPFMVTTYEYEIGVGIKKMTDPRGRNMTYQYDAFNRLEKVFDHQGNLVSENQYKYATQN